MGSLWLITTYFNPLHWRSRRENYRVFRRHLGANLLAVEWSPTGHHSLEAGDADRLIQVGGGDLMWQKERLLNLGLAHLPADCTWVGWLDCDILFCDPHWSRRAVEQLAHHEVVQLYGAVEYLGPGAPIQALPGDPPLRGANRRPSIAHAWRSAPDPDLHLSEDLRVREWLTADRSHVPLASDTSAGFAWAARRSWLEAVGGLPDRAIVGGGDLQSAYGLLGRLKPYAEALERCGLGAYCCAHTRRWAERVRSTAPRVGSLEGTILHLHHGDLADRGYLRRQFDLLRTGFRPDHHLEPDPAGAWRFAPTAPASIRTVMAGYFASRREDSGEAVLGPNTNPNQGQGQDQDQDRDRDRDRGAGFRADEERPGGCPSLPVAAARGPGGPHRSLPAPSCDDPPAAPSSGRPA